MAAEAPPKGSGFGDVPPAPFFISSRSQDSPHETSLAIPPQARPTCLQLTGHLCGAEEAEQAEPTAPGSPCCCPCLVSSPSAQTFSWETTTILLCDILSRAWQARKSLKYLVNSQHTLNVLLKPKKGFGKPRSSAPAGLRGGLRGNTAQEPTLGQKETPHVANNENLFPGLIYTATKQPLLCSMLFAPFAGSGSFPRGKRLCLHPKPEQHPRQVAAAPSGKHQEVSESPSIKNETVSALFDSQGH